MTKSIIKHFIGFFKYILDCGEGWHTVDCVPYGVCDLCKCGTVLEEYCDIINTLKDANLLDKNHPLICCRCYNDLKYRSSKTMKRFEKIMGVSFENYVARKKS